MDPLDPPLATRSATTQSTDDATPLGSARPQFRGVQSHNDELSGELASSEKSDLQSASDILSSDTAEQLQIFQTGVPDLSLSFGTPTRHDGYSVVESSFEVEPNRLVHRRPHSRLGDIYQVIIDCWIAEALACAGSLLALFGIIATLLVYNGSSQPNWPYGITINSVIALFGTAMKALMLVAIAACIGQAKWTYFHSKTHSLGDMVIYDSASRGPQGSIQLLWKFQARYVASLGALITILIVGLDPFVQQVISIESRHIASKYNSTLDRAQSFLEWQDSSTEYIDILPVTFDMLGALYNGIYSASGGPNKVSFGMNPLCATGNCTFPLFQSLAVCHHCRNITDSIEGSCQQSPGSTDYIICQYHLPNGLRLNSSTLSEDLLEGIGSIATSGYLQPVGYAEFGNTLLNFTRMSPRARGPDYDANPRSITADECFLYWCVNTYEAAVVNGTLNEKVIHSWHSNSTEWHQNADRNNNIWLDLLAPAIDGRSAPSIFRVAYLATTSLTSWLAATMSVSNSQDTGFSGTDGEFGTEDVTANLTFEAQDTIRVLWQEDIDALFSNLAASITRSVREVDWEMQTFGDGWIKPVTGAGTANGTAWSLEVVIHVRWQWLIFPMALVALTMLFLALTVIETAGSRVEVWKSSPVPLLAHGLENAEATPLRMAARLGEMEKLAESISVRLEETDTGWRLAR